MFIQCLLLSLYRLITQRYVLLIFSSTGGHCKFKNNTNITQKED